MQCVSFFILSLCRDGVSDISYELVQGCSLDEGEPVVSLLSSGDIFTAGFNGHAVVMVTAHETDIRLNQSIIVHVEVRKRERGRVHMVEFCG